MNDAVDKIEIETRPIKWIQETHLAGNIIIDNSFQRKFVWTEADMVSLIETILIGCPIPEIYLWQRKTDPKNGDTQFSVVDGQQRIGTVIKFLNEDFRLKKSHLDFKDASYANKMFSELSDKERSLIWKYKFSIRFIKEVVTDIEISNLFLRLNRTNTTLNPQELRNAEFNGRFIKLAEQIAELEFWEQFEIFNLGDIRRMRDLEFISTLLIFLRMGIEEDTNQTSINKAYDLYNENYPQAESDLKDVKKCLSILEILAADSSNTLEFLPKKTHLYTLFLFAYYLSTLKIPKKNLRNYKERLDLWFAAYENKRKLTSTNDKRLLSRYRHLSQEGSKKKANRIERLEILKSFCEPRGTVPNVKSKSQKK